jgi:peptidoglycan/LPS O-acetylase OafA/YrhL
MQLYLFFPALLWLLRRTAGHHLALFLGSLVLEMAMMAAVHWWQWGGAWAAVQEHDYVLSPLYQFYFLAGGLAAVHFDRFHAWVVGHPRGVLGLVLAGAVLHEGAFAIQVAVTGSPAMAADSLQPTMVPWSLAVAVGFYAAGVTYARKRRSASAMSRFIDQASLASFGVYLVHPLWLNVVLGRWLSFGDGVVPPLAGAALAWIGTLVLSGLFAAVAIRSPLALALTGRKRLRPDAAAGAAA